MKIRNRPEPVPGPHRHHRRGSAYVMVLGASMIVLTIGLSALMLTRVQNHLVSETNDTNQAQFHAQSAIDIAMLKLRNQRSNDPNWRLTGIATTTQQMSIGNAQITWNLADEVDGDIGNDPTHPFWLSASVHMGKTVRVVRAEVKPTPPRPLEILGRTVYGAVAIRINPGRSLTLTGGPASTDGEFRNEGSLGGSTDAASLYNGDAGVLTGTAQIVTPATELPPAQVFDDYVAMATQLAHVGDINAMVLSPGVNEYGGGLNASGIYYINTGGNDLVIRCSRIHGTLVVDTGLGNVLVQNQVFMKSFRADHPVLLVRGDVDLIYTSEGADNERFLRESDWGHNFNPVGAPDADEDNDQLDQYPSEIDGLVHVTGRLIFHTTSRVRGVVICEKEVRIQGDASIHHDPQLLVNPPLGYTDPGGDLRLVPGSWEQVVGIGSAPPGI